MRNPDEQDRRLAVLPDGPAELRFHPEGEKGGWLWREWRQGAIGFGWVAPDGSESLPLGWREVPAGWQLMAEHPGGVMKLLAGAEPGNDSKAAASSHDADGIGAMTEAAMSILAEDLPEWEAHGETREKLDAGTVRRLIGRAPELMTESELAAFMAGFVYRGMMDSGLHREAARKDGNLQKARTAVNPYLSFAREALAAHGSLGADELLRAIGGSYREEKVAGRGKLMIRRWHDGTEMSDLEAKDWRSAVTAAGQAAGRSGSREI